MLMHLSRFLQVGAVAFAVDGGVLWLLVYQFGMPPVISRAFSFLVTIALTFVLNARYTFVVPVRESSKSRYVVIQSAGAALNFIGYTVLVLTGSIGPLWSLVAGSALSSTHNFLMMRRFVFHRATDHSAI